LEFFFTWIIRDHIKQESFSTLNLPDGRTSCIFSKSGHLYFYKRQGGIDAIALTENLIFALDHHARFAFFYVVHQFSDFIFGAVPGFPELAQDALQIKR